MNPLPTHSSRRPVYGIGAVAVIAVGALVIIGTTLAFHAIDRIARAQGGDVTPPAAATSLASYFLAPVISSPRVDQVFDVGESITFDGSQSQGATTYTWSIPGVGGAAPTTATTTASFAAPGVWSVQLSIGDGTHTRSVRVPVTVRRKVAVVLVGSAASLAAVSSPSYVEGRTDFRCVQDALLSGQLVQSFDMGMGTFDHQYSLGNLQAWYDREFATQRVGTTVTPVQFSVVPTLVTVADTPPARSGTDPCNATLQSYFDAKAAGAGIDLTGYQSVAYAFLHDNAVVDYFWSCAEGTGAQPGRAYIDFGLTWNLADPAQTSCDTRDIQVILHEVNHNFGSTDTYDGFRCLDPNGLADPDRNPKYPQVKAALMCGKIALDANSGTSPSGATLFDDVVISSYTAQEIAWRSGCSADGFCQTNPAHGVYETAASCPADCAVPAAVCTGRSCTGGTCQVAALGVNDLLAQPGNFAPYTTSTIWNTSSPACDNDAGQKFNFSNAPSGVTPRFHAVKAYFSGANLVDEPVNVTVDVVSEAAAAGDPGSDILHAWVSDNGRDWIECPTVTHAKGSYTASIACGRLTAANPQVRFRFDTTAQLQGGAFYLRALHRLALTP